MNKYLNKGDIILENIIKTNSIFISMRNLEGTSKTVN